jgi:membrane-associated phospholipid phosphatase
VAQDGAWPEQNRRVGWTEATVIGGAAAALAGVHYGLGRPPNARWVGPILVDDAVRNAMLANDDNGISLAAAASDVLLLSLMSWSVVIDSVGVAGLANDDWDSALQTSTIAVQSQALNALATTALKYVIGRRRPGFGRCYDAPDSHADCAKRPNVSFPSGHTSSAFTGAGLMCAMRRSVVYFGRTADRVTCFTAMAMATATGLLRVASNNHYLSDILAGAALGFTMGWVLPTLVYTGDDAAVQGEAQSLGLTGPPPTPPMLQWGGSF